MTLAIEQLVMSYRPFIFVGGYNSAPLATPTPGNVLVGIATGLGGSTPDSTGTNSGGFDSGGGVISPPVEHRHVRDVVYDQYPFTAHDPESVCAKLADGAELAFAGGALTFTGWNAFVCCLELSGVDMPEDVTAYDGEAENTDTDPNTATSHTPRTALTPDAGFLVVEYAVWPGIVPDAFFTSFAMTTPPGGGWDEYVETVATDNTNDNVTLALRVGLADGSALSQLETVAGTGNTASTSTAVFSIPEPITEDAPTTLDLRLVKVPETAPPHQVPTRVRDARRR